MKVNPVLIFVSILCAFLLYVSPGFVFSIILTIFLFHLAFKNTDTHDRRFILSVMSIAILLRLITIVFVQYFCFAKGKLDIFGDAANNFELGHKIESLLGGNYIQLKILKETDWYNVHGLTFFNGIFFTIFGNNEIVTLKYLNSLSLVVAGWLIYDLTKRIYSRLAGKIAMSILLFWPTLFVWSITGLKDSHFILALTSVLWGMDRINSKINLRNCFLFLLLIFISSIYLISLRLKSMLPIMLAFFISVSIYFIFRWCVSRASYRTIRAFILVFVLCLILFLFREGLFQTVTKVYDRMISMNKGFLSSGGFNYNLFGDNDNIFTIKFFFKYLFGAWFHFLLEPLPWNFASLNMLSVYPMMMVWYFMLFASLAGIKKIYLMGNMHRIFFSLVFTILYITANGMVVANIGTAVRFRDAIVPIVAMLAACGITNPQKKYLMT